MFRRHPAGRHRVFSIFLLPVLIAGLCAPARVTALEQPLVINTTARAPHYIEDGSGFINRLVAEIFRRLDIEHELVWLPAERSLVFTNNGAVDAVVPRAAAIEKKYPDLVRVPVEVFRFDFMAYVRDPATSIDGWQGLKPYSVGLIKGWKIVEQNTGEARMISKVNDYEQLLNMLDKGRVDVAILDRVMGGWVLKNLGFELQPVEPPLASVPTYFYLHRKHAGLVEKISAVLYEMKRDGAYAEIQRNTLEF